MTLELTPDQRDIIRDAVQTRLDGCNSAALALWDAPASTKAALTDEAIRLESLLSLLNVPHTTVILHQP